MNKLTHRMQNTITDEVMIEGIGLHSGQKASMRLLPANENSGISFVRKDVKGFDNVVNANYQNVCQTQLGTSITNDEGTIISTIEHFMAALWALKIDNLNIEINGPEVPIMDGSSISFIKAINEVGISEQKKVRKAFKLKQEVAVQEGDKIAKLVPSDHFSVELEIDFQDKVISRQKAIFSGSRDEFINEFSEARTFGFEHEVEYMHKHGLALGGSLKNAIVVGKKGILNKEGLRFKNEFVKHKILDCLGDLYLAGGKIFGHFVGYKSGHDLNNKLLRKLFANKSAWAEIS